jgi:hypothetical protein
LGSENEDPASRRAKWFRVKACGGSMSKKYRAYCNRCGRDLSEAGTPYAVIDLGTIIKRGDHETSWRYPRLFFCSSQCISDFLAGEVEKSIKNLDSYEAIDQRMASARKEEKETRGG